MPLFDTDDGFTVAQEGRNARAAAGRLMRRSHWLPFPFLLALPVMVWVHHLLGLSDALMIQTPPGEREAHTYNLVTVMVGWAAIGFFFIHTLSLRHRGWRWVVGKLMFLAT